MYLYINVEINTVRAIRPKLMGPDLVTTGIDVCPAIIIG
jgi:hypothetical protein